MKGNKPILYKKLEVFSNENDKSVDIRAGVPVLEYRESVLSPYITIDLSIIDAGTATEVDDGTRGTIGLLESIKLQADEKFKLILEDEYDNCDFLKFLLCTICSHLRRGDFSYSK